MNLKEVSELRRRFRMDRNAISRIYGCFVNSSREIVSYIDESMGILPQDEAEKYLNLLKKALSGKLGKNLIDIIFSTEQVADSDEHRLLMALRDSQLKDGDIREEFYQKIINSLDLGDSNYLILLAHDSYDVPRKNKNDEMDADASDAVARALQKLMWRPVPASQRIPCLPRSCWVLWAAYPPMIGISKRLLLIPVLHPKFSVRNPSEPLATYILTMRMSLKSSGNIVAAELSIRQPKSWTCAFLSMASRETRAAKKTAIRLFCEEGSLWNML